MKSSLHILAVSLFALVLMVACGSEAPTPTLTPTPTVEPTIDPTPAPPSGGWTQSDDGSDLSLSLEAYETGSDDGNARLMVTCFNSPPLGQYISADITWDTPVSVLYDLGVQLNWDSGSTMDTPVSVLYDLGVQLNWDSGSTISETWDGSPAGNNVTPRRKQLDQKFIDGLLEHSHLEFAVDSDKGSHRAKFNVTGFEQVYEPFKAECENRPTSGKDYLE